MNLPEVQLKKILDGVLLGIRKDTIAYTANETVSYLYRLLNGNTLEKWNFYTQAKDIFNRAVDHPRIIETRVFFDRTRAGLPTIHITLPNLQAGNDGIGIDEGYQDLIDNSLTLEQTPVYTRSFQTTYHMIITSDNAFEVLTIYHVVKAALIANMESLEYYGLRNVKFSGQDLQINEQLVPVGIFSRGIGLNLMYEADIPVFRLIPSVSDITPIIGMPIESEVAGEGIEVEIDRIYDGGDTYTIF